jgi:hybrid cluster-associated redox disulfide protein
MINVLAVLLTLGTLGVATMTWFRQRSLRDALRDALRRLYLAQVRLNELESTVQKELQALRSMVQRQSAGSLIEPTMKVAEAIALDPRMRDVFAQFHLGGCSSCSINEEDTIEQAAMRYGIDLGRLMATLAALSHGQEPPLQETRHSNLLQLTEF